MGETFNVTPAAATAIAAATSQSCRLGSAIQTTGPSVDYI